jgi:hypothetical protein
MLGSERCDVTGYREAFHLLSSRVTQRVSNGKRPGTGETFMADMYPRYKSDCIQVFLKEQDTYVEEN